MKGRDKFVDEEICIDSDFILLNCCAKSKSEAIGMLGRKMQNKGFVKESFVDAVLEREKKYPTGLEIGKTNIAIPHTEPEHVNKPCIGVMVLNDTVPFQKMDDLTSLVNVKVIFLIALKNGHGHMELLRNIMLTCRDQSFLNELITADNIDEIKKELQRKLLM